ncbi:MAG: glycerol-3-phosphate 1-O-acyltransferase PlsY [Wenzhouxiangellaceae bacterium]
MSAVLLAVLAGYLLGSVSGSLVLGRVWGVDIRSRGSGNAGGTNALRTVGWRFALAVVLIDVGKGALAVWLAPALVSGLGLDAGADPLPTAALAGFAAVIGHVWPVYFGFRGGKGAGTAVGVVAILAPWCLAPLVVVWLVTLLATGYVGLATVLAGLSLVPSMWVFGPRPLPGVLGALAIALAVLLVLTHRSNLRRLLDGTEHRFEKARVLRRR